MLFVCIKMAENDSYGSIGTEIQMLALGPEDIHLKANPEVTFWSGGQIRSKTHTPFALINCTHDFDVPPRFSDDDRTAFKCVLERRAHVLKMLYIEITFPDLEDTFLEGVGHRMIEYVSIVAAGSALETMTGSWLATRQQLASGPGKEVREMTDGVSIGGGFKRAYVHLPFGLIRSLMSPGIPLISLYNQECFLQLKLADAMYFLKSGADPGVLENVRFRLLSDQALLSTAEIQRLFLDHKSTRDIMYLQIREQFELYDSGVRTIRIPIDFNGYCRRIMIVLRDRLQEPVEDSLESARLFVGNVEAYPSGPKNMDGTRVAPEYWNLVAPVLRKGDRPVKSVYCMSFSLNNPMEPWKGLGGHLFNIGGPKPVEEMCSHYTEQPLGALNLSNTVNIVELTIKSGSQVSLIHLVAECYNIMTAKNGWVDSLYVN